MRNLETEHNETEESTIWNKNFIYIMVANFMLCLGHFSVNPLVASYTKYLNTGAQLTGFLTGLLFGVALAMRPFAGPATTKLDKRMLLIVVFVLGFVSNLGYALFQSVPVFTAFRVLSGIQYGLVGPLLMTLAGDNVPKSKITYGLGVYGIGGAISTATAPSIGEAILRFGTNIRDESFGFVLMFLMGAAAFAVAVIPAVLLKPDKKTKEEVASTGAWYKNIFTPHAIPVTIVFFMVIIPHSIITTYIFEFGKEQGIEGAGIFYLVLALTLAAIRPVSGYLIYRFGVAKVMIPALSLYALAMYIISVSASLGMLIAGAVLVAVGNGTAQPSLQAMCLQTETPLRRGIASNTLYIGFDTSLFVGPVAGGFVYAASDYSVMFKSSIAPIFLAIIGLLIILPMHRRRMQELD